MTLLKLLTAANAQHTHSKGFVFKAHTVHTAKHLLMLGF